MKNDPKIGHIIDTPQTKDAIHVAIAPVEAATDFYPGQHVGLSPSGTACSAVAPIGIVDPFLKNKVMKGDWFWVFLYPNTITSLRHDWTHPAFLQQPKTQDTPPIITMDPSEKWLREFAANEADGIAYEDLMDAAHCYQNHGDYLSQGGRFEGMYIPEEFWQHFTAVTSKEVTDKGSFFSCSC